MSTLDFWEVLEARFIRANDDQPHILADYQRSVAYLASTQAAPNVWISSDSLAKSFYSTIMADLGQSTARPNILNDEISLQYFTKNFTAMQSDPSNARPGPARDSYDALKEQNKTGLLQITPAVISTKYFCQMPQQKSAGALFVSIRVADLVLMQAAWKILTLCANAWLTRKHPKGKVANYFYVDINMS
jgi:hypothetical protein